MNWVIYTFIAIGIVGISDLFRKLASASKDPFFTNLIFQSGAFLAGLTLYLIFSRSVVRDMKLNSYALIGGLSIATFTLFSFKALATGPGASHVIPVIRTGGMIMLVLLSILVLKENLTPRSILGLLFSCVGIYLLLVNK